MSNEVAIEFFQKVRTYYGTPMNCHLWTQFTREAKLNLARSYSSGLPFQGRPAVDILAWKGLTPSQIVSQIDAYCLAQAATRSSMAAMQPPAGLRRLRP